MCQPVTFERRSVTRSAGADGDSKTSARTHVAAIASRALPIDMRAHTHVHMHYTHIITTKPMIVYIYIYTYIHIHICTHICLYSDIHSLAADLCGTLPISTLPPLGLRRTGQRRVPSENFVCPFTCYI